MDPLTIAAASGLRARLESFDLLSNNLANTSTNGFKADRESYSIYVGEDSLVAAAEASGASQTVSPLVERNWVDVRQGLLRRSGEEHDLALEGSGFFVVDGTQGPLLARSASIHVARDGRLVNRDGYEMITVEPRRVRADPTYPVEVQGDGSVVQQGQLLGHLKIASIPSANGSVKRQGVYFVLDSSSLPDLKKGTGVVKQGFIEESNVNPGESATRLVEILRQFEGLQRAIQIGGEMNKRTIEEVARVTS